jgi:3-phosphoglycerate kinase
MEKYSNKIVLPIDCVAARELEPNTPRLTIKLSEGIPDDYKGFDIGPETLHLFKDALALAKTVLWNGPLGAFECHPFGHGTAAIAAYLAHLSKAKTIIGGGDLAAAIKKTGVAEKLAHISTGGGATLEYIEHGTLPGIDALSDKK